MRKLLISMIAIVALGTGAAFAQTGTWAGVSFGYPLGVVLHYGLEDLFGPGIDVRANVSGSYRRIGIVTVTAFAVGADVLYRLDDVIATDQPISTYVGGGLTLGFASARAEGTRVGFAAYDVHALFGAEYSFTQELSAFVEAQVGFGSIGAAGPGGTAVAATGLIPRLALGVNYRF
jgi:hypothetical protein